MALLEFTDKGIFCPTARVYLDPWRPVERALITHGHSDHARAGHRHYLATAAAAPIIRHRLGADVETIAFGEKLTINGVEFSFHPAGHIMGSAQIRVAYKGEVWVFTGDYKTEPDGLTETFESVRCSTMITECTFGLPVFNWRPQTEVLEEINDWWRTNKAIGKASVIGAYSLGKAQRVLAGVDPSIGPIFTHGAVEGTNEVLRAQGIKLPDTTYITADIPRSSFAGSLVIAPPSALGSSWMRRIGPASTGVASGWMALRGVRRRRAVDRGFVLSDHVDWQQLNDAVKASDAERVYVTHGYTSVFRRWLETQGYDARIAQTDYEGEALDESTKENAEADVTAEGGATS
ncbi:MAG: ligase-associated DNA damage response exonuclease [Filomicrobium sp.]